MTSLVWDAATRSFVENPASEDLARPFLKVLWTLCDFSAETPLSLGNVGVSNGKPSMWVGTGDGTIANHASLDGHMELAAEHSTLDDVWLVPAARALEALRLTGAGMGSEVAVVGTGAMPAVLSALSGTLGVGEIHFLESASTAELSGLEPSGPMVLILCGLDGPSVVRMLGATNEGSTIALLDVGGTDSVSINTYSTIHRRNLRVVGVGRSPSEESLRRAHRLASHRLDSSGVTVPVIKGSTTTDSGEMTGLCVIEWGA